MSDSATHAVFLSYAREDMESARRIADALNGFGVEVWFDQSELRGGDAWDQKIRDQIKDCTLFVPVISAHTQSRREGYFRREWKLAVERTHDMAEGVPFIAPVVVDDTAESRALAPAEFLRVQWTRLPGGLPTPQFIAQIKRLLAQTLAPAETLAGERAPGAAPVTSRRSPAWGWIAVVVALVGIAFLTLRKIEQSGSPSPIAANPAPAATKVTVDKSIAVLPFENLSDDKDSGFFADGVHEDVLTSLYLIPELKVISRTSVMQYRNTKKTVRQIGDELGVAYVLEGSVRRAGDMVRVTGQLINTRTDQHLWAKNYDKKLTDLFAIQSELAQSIAAELRAKITPETQSILDQQKTKSPEAYDLHLKVRALADDVSNTRSSLEQQEAFLRSAVGLDPGFALAWADLGRVHATMYFFEFDHSAERAGNAKRAIDRAVKLGPNDPDVIRNHGMYYLYALRDFPNALDRFQRGLQLKPGDARGWHNLALVYRRQGRWQEAIADLRRAVELDPNNLLFMRQLSIFLGDVRRWDEALVWRRRVGAAAEGRQTRDTVIAAELTFFATGAIPDIDELVKTGPTRTTISSRYLYDRLYWAAMRKDLAEVKRLAETAPEYRTTRDAVPGEGTMMVVEAMQWVGVTPELKTKLETLRSDLAARFQVDPTAYWVCRRLAAAESLLGNHVRALELVRRSMELRGDDANDSPSEHVLLAKCLIRAGEKDRAIDELTRVINVSKGPNVHELQHWGTYDPLRGNPRFEALINDPKNNAPLF